MTQLVEFLGVAALVIATPGQDIALLPQFSRSFAALSLLGLLFCSLTLVWLTAYALAVGRAGDERRRSRIRRTIDAVTGMVLVALGLRLAAERG